MTKRTINIYGVRQNNLKNISLKIPKHKIVVFTGVSGSGKSSLVFETIGAKLKDKLMKLKIVLYVIACNILVLLTLIKLKI